MKVICSYCQQETDKPKGEVNRAQAKGANLFCSQKCCGDSKRKGLTDAEKKEAKRIYDEKRRIDKAEILRAKKAEYYARTKDREKEREIRKKRMPAHVEYCRRPEYKAKKAEYDREHLAKKKYGEYWESALLIRDIESQYDQREVRENNNLHNKSQKRKALWLQLKKKASLLST